MSRLASQMRRNHRMPQLAATLCRGKYQRFGSSSLLRLPGRAAFDSGIEVMLRETSLAFQWFRPYQSH